MSSYGDYLNAEDDEDGEARRQAKARSRPKRSRDEIIATLVEAGDTVEAGFNPSFHASRHERAWIITYLGPFYEDHVILDVLRQVKGGKEATVYCCTAGPSTGAPLIAAKVYRPRMFRNLRNDALYREGGATLDREGKGVRDRRSKLAMAKKTDFGLEVLQTAWLANEFGTLGRLHAAGADVPRPFTHSDNAILMEYLGTPQQPAPALNHVRLPPDEARPLFDRLLANVELMLAHDRVHGDLSAYNVLYWEGEVKIIDFPQAVAAFANPHARALLTRDVQRLCQYFAPYGITADGERLASDFWRRHMLAEDYEIDHPEASLG